MQLNAPNETRTRILCDDLDSYLGDWGSNAERTEAQQQNWPKGKLSHRQLGQDAKDALRLMENDGWDGKPVCSVTANSAERFWSRQTDHMVPRIRDLVRFGLFFHLGFYQIVALILKAEWERFIYRKHRNEVSTKVNVHDILSEEYAEHHKDAFKPKTAEIVRLHPRATMGSGRGGSWRVVTQVRNAAVIVARGSRARSFSVW